MSVLAILAQGDGWVVVDKPPGVLVIPGRGESEAPCVRELLEAQLRSPVLVVHRLDRDTSGCLLFALTAEVHRELSMAFEHGQVEKHYAALAQGAWPGEHDVQVALAPARRGKMRPTRPGEAGKEARTVFRALEVWGETTLLDARPMTGRTHQIRVHLLSQGHGLLVDPQYGQAEAWGVGGEVLLGRTPLHAARVRFSVRGAQHVVEAPLAADMARALVRLRGLEKAL